MALIVNGVTIPSSGVVTYNGVSLDKVICNGVTVFEKIIREPASGEYYNKNSPSFLWYVNDKYHGTTLYWNDTEIVVPYGVTSYSDGTYTYFKGQTLYVYNSTFKIGHWGIYRIKN